MSDSPHLIKALLISNDSDFSGLFEDVSGAELFSLNLVVAKDTVKTLDILQTDRVDVIFLDCSISESVIDFIEELRKRNIVTPVIAVIEPGHELQAAEALKKGAYDYIIVDSSWQESLQGKLKKILDLVPMERISEDEQELQSLLFRQIYKSGKWWQHIIDAITDYLYVIDDEYKILRTNKAFANLFNKEPADIIMRPYYELFGIDKPHEWCVLPRDKDNFKAGSFERQINGSIYLISCFPIFYDRSDAVVYTMKDITETRKLKDQVYHLDKLSSLGTLTSGVAHEINNPLTGIIGYTEMLLMKSVEGKEKKYLENIYESAMRCKRIVGNMLTFSRQKPSLKSPEDINNIIDKTIELHEYWLRSNNIEIVREYDNVPYISIDQQQIQQVILNLIINAEHAISEADRLGRIEFSTKYDHESGQIIITVTDNGNGIPEDVLPRIFDPFYTTKPVNKGTGLGLSIAHGIIAEEAGTIEASSVMGERTSFVIRLPKGEGS